jgi:two-component system, chemotaxis family, sensor kinase CheA
MVNESFINDDMKEFIEDFLVESKELIEKVDQELVELEKAPDDLNLLNSIFRAVHTIKGTSSFIGIVRITEFTHDVESVLNKLRNMELKLNSEIMDVVLKSVDVIRDMMQDVENGIEPSADIKELTGHIRDILENADNIAKPVETSEKNKKANPENNKKEKITVDNAESKTQNSLQVHDSTVILAEKVESNKAGIVQSSEAIGKNMLIGELLIEKGYATQEQIANALDEQERSPKIGEILISKNVINKEALEEVLDIQKKSDIQVEQTIRVEIKRLDVLMNIVSELVLSRNRLVQISKVFEESYENDNAVKNLSELSNTIDLLTADLHTSLMRVRMVPIHRVFSKYPRMIRDLARDTKKEIDLVISGSETELDKSLIEDLNDPLIHLIRNSADHGIETPAERKLKGKPVKGTVKLKAYHDGNDIVIEIEDDGKGIDVEALKEKALEKKLISKIAAEKMTDKEVFNMIFLPGFSTAKVVTEVSGRGVGMDVVKTNIEKLKGIIEINSIKDIGTSVKLKLPLTLEIIQALIVGVYGEFFSIPLTATQEILNIKTENIKTVKGIEVINSRDTILSLVRLDRVFNIKKKDDIDNSYIVVVGSAEQRMGLVVTELIGKEEIVIKPIDSKIQSGKGLSGATIMGDGHVSLVIDVPGLIRQILQR